MNAAGSTTIGTRPRRLMEKKPREVRKRFCYSGRDLVPAKKGERERNPLRIRPQARGVADGVNEGFLSSLFCFLQSHY